MIKIRLKRIGRKKKACYRIIAIHNHFKRDGKAIQELGFYNPLTKQITIDLNQIQHKIAEGAKLTQTVQYLLESNKN